jgi:hypothetical protein
MLVYRLLRCLVGFLAVLVRSDLSKDAELLVVRHENQVLRRQISGPAVGSRRPGLAGGAVPAGKPPPVAGGLPGHPGNAAALTDGPCLRDDGEGGHVAVRNQWLRTFNVVRLR